MRFVAAFVTDKSCCDIGNRFYQSTDGTKQVFMGWYASAIFAPETHLLNFVAIFKNNWKLYVKRLHKFCLLSLK